MADWKTIKLGDFLTPYRIEHIIQSDRDYKQVTIAKSGTISLRGVQSGSKIGRKRQFQIDLKKYPNTVLFTRQGVLDGAIGIAPPNIDKCLVTENMPMMSVDTNVIAIEYLRKLLLSDYFFEKVRKLKIVGSAQKSIHERDLLQVEIDLPDKDSQMEMCKKFYVLDTEHVQLSQELTHQQTLLKKLRQQILQEAIEGKLTADWRADNPDVEPAGELLARIRAEKAQLIKDKKIKKQNPLPPICEDEKPFELPVGWVWCRIGLLFNKFSTGPFGSMLHKSDYVSNGIPLVNPANIINEAIVSSKKMLIDQETRKRLSKYVLQVGEFVIARRGDLSKCAIVTKKEEGWLCGTGSFFIQPSNLISKKFFVKVYSSLFFQHRLTSASVGQTMANLNQKILNKSIFPLPPLPEQKAIVSKVEKLLTLCDQLETQNTSNQTHAKQLMQAVLKEAFTHTSEQNEKELAHT